MVIETLVVGLEHRDFDDSGGCDKFRRTRHENLLEMSPQIVDWESRRNFKKWSDKSIHLKLPRDDFNCEPRQWKCSHVTSQKEKQFELMLSTSNYEVIRQRYNLQVSSSAVTNMCISRMTRRNQNDNWRPQNLKWSKSLSKKADWIVEDLVCFWKKKAWNYTQNQSLLCDFLILIGYHNFQIII